MHLGNIEVDVPFMILIVIVDSGHCYSFWVVHLHKFSTFFYDETVDVVLKVTVVQFEI